MAIMLFTGVILIWGAIILAAIAIIQDNNKPVRRHRPRK